STDCHEPTQALRSQNQDVFYVERQHCSRDRRENEDRVQRDKYDHRNDDPVRAHVAKAFTDPAAALFFFLGRPERSLRQRHQRYNESDKGKRIGKKRGRRAPPSDEKSSQRRTDQARSMEYGTI